LTWPIKSEGDNLFDKSEIKLFHEWEKFVLVEFAGNQNPKNTLARSLFTNYPFWTLA